jgi:hypothetical protein
MSFALYLVRADVKKIKCAPLPKSAFCPRLFQASAAPWPENSDSDEKDALFGLDTQITIVNFRLSYFCFRPVADLDLVSAFNRWA